ncbi:MAG: hypothetical protein KDC04_07200 [Saprospiraceae bacterium]|nr:hypothetical protein [Saprospiraceae bacterium]MCB9310220.1 hypothetical protein [Lewinellaceae bacterium]
MSKYRVKNPYKRAGETAQDKADEKKFYRVAIITTLVIILLIYLIFKYM